MDKQEREFILNKGYLLGIILILFPVTDFMFGFNMSNTNYFLIFGLLWFVVYSYLIIKWTKVVSTYYEYFPFKESFRTLFLISALAFSILTVGKTLLWTVSFPEKYIEINEKRELGFYSLQKTVIDDAYQNGTFSDDQYDEQLQVLNGNKTLLKDKWRVIRSEGLGLTYFLQVLITVLFFISIYCAILALILRRKEPIVKTN